MWFVVDVTTTGGGLPNVMGVSCSGSAFSAPLVSVSMPVVLRGVKKLRGNTDLGGSLIAEDVVTGLVDFLAVCEVYYASCVPLLSRSRHPELSCLCTYLKVGLQFSQCYRVQSKKAASHPELISSALFTTEVQSRAFPHLAGAPVTRFSMSLSNLFTCCTTEAASGYIFVMTWHSYLSDASSCVYYFRNLGTGTSAILAHTQVHCMFWCFAQHCTHSRPSGNLHRHYLRQTGVVSKHTTKVKSVNTTLPNTRFIHVTKANCDLM
jgi:hypothetical protein